MARANYCRREVTAHDGTARPCGNKIASANALNWCEACRKRLPLWPDGPERKEAAPITLDAFEPKGGE